MGPHFGATWPNTRAYQYLCHRALTLRDDWQSSFLPGCLSPLGDPLVSVDLFYKTPSAQFDRISRLQPGEHNQSTNGCYSFRPCLAIGRFTEKLLAHYRSWHLTEFVVAELITLRRMGLPVVSSQQIFAWGQRLAARRFTETGALSGPS